MSAIFVGAGNGAGQALSPNVPMPAGTGVGDWFLLACVSVNPAMTATFPGATVLLTQVTGTMTVFLVKKQVTAADIANGFTFNNTLGSDSIRWGVVVYRTGFGTPGTPTTRSSSSTTIVADGDSLSPAPVSNQTVVVIRYEKSTNNPGPAAVSPATNLRTSTYANAASAPSLWIGDYAGPQGDRTFTDSVASANGLGIQIAVIEPAVMTYTVTVWNGTAEVPATLKVWNGTAEQPATVST